MPNFETLLEAFNLLNLNESKQDQLNFENKFGKDLTLLYIQLKPKIKSPENDFYFWIKNKTKEELSDFLTELQTTKSVSQIKKEDKKDAELIYSKDGWKIYKILTYDASKYYGKGTRRCISGNYAGQEARGAEFFNQYLDYGVKNYYFIINSNDEKWCYLDYILSKAHMVNGRFWTAEDNDIALTSVDFHENIPDDVLDNLPNFREAFISCESDDIINDEEFKGETHLREAPIKDTTVIIGNQAFAQCSNLRSVIIPNSVRTIGEGAFSGCTSMSKLDLGTGLKSIGEEAFLDCIALVNLNIPNSVINIDSCAFDQCKRLTKVTIGSGLEKINDWLFTRCESLKDINIPNNITHIGDKAFSRCISLKSIDIPESVNSLGSMVFDGCKQLQKIKIGNPNIKIPDFPFEECYDLTEITFGNTCYRDFNFGYPDYDYHKGCIVVTYNDDSDSWDSANFNIEQLKKDFKTLYHTDHIEVRSSDDETLVSCD